MEVCTKTILIGLLKIKLILGCQMALAINEHAPQVERNSLMMYAQQPI